MNVYGYSHYQELQYLAGASDEEAGGARRRPDSDSEPESDLRGEWPNITLLCLLYTLQGIPMGLAAVLPLMLKERGVSFGDLSMFSLNSYPFSLKLLWAPMVRDV